MVDDTNHPRFDSSPWPWVVNKTYPTPSDDKCSLLKTEEVGGAPLASLLPSHCSSNIED